MDAHVLTVHLLEVCRHQACSRRSREDTLVDITKSLLLGASLHGKLNTLLVSGMCAAIAAAALFETYNMLLCATPPRMRARLQRVQNNHRQELRNFCHICP